MVRIAFQRFKYMPADVTLRCLVLVSKNGFKKKVWMLVKGCCEPTKKLIIFNKIFLKIKFIIINKTTSLHVQELIKVI